MLAATILQERDTALEFAHPCREVIAVLVIFHVITVLRIYVEGNSWLPCA
jgi:hypothetical protein